MVPSAVHIPRVNVVKPTGKHTATLFLFHGSGGNGEDLKQWLDIVNRRELNFPHLKIVFPSAPIQPYTPNNGMLSNVWFDRKAITNEVTEALDSVDAMCKKASELIEKEVSEGIPVNRIAIGGFSMGGALSLHLAYRFQRSIAGCIAMSAFLNKDSAVIESLKKDKPSQVPELLYFHGTSDEIVPIEWAKKSYEDLLSVGVKGTFIPLEQRHHEIVSKEVNYIKDWLLKKLPNQ